MYLLIDNFLEISGATTLHTASDSNWLLKYNKIGCNTGYNKIWIQ